LMNGMIKASSMSSFVSWDIFSPCSFWSKVECLSWRAWYAYLFEMKSARKAWASCKKSLIRGNYSSGSIKARIIMFVKFWWTLMIGRTTCRDSPY
jgi:hypothetical protein